MKGLISFALKLAVTAVILLILSRYLYDANLHATLAGTDLRWLGAAVLVMLLQAGLAAARWKEVLLRLTGIVLPLRVAFAWNGTSTLIGQVLPSTIGGDAFRVGMLAAESDLAKGLRAVLADRILGLVALGIVVLVAGSQLIALSGSPTASVPLAIGLSGCLGTLFVVLAGPYIPANQRLLQPFALISRDLRAILDTPHRISSISLVSLLIHLLSIVTFAMLARALNVNVGLLDIGIVAPCALLISAVPISLGGWGLREGAMYLGFQLIGSDPAAAVALSLMFGFVNLLVAAMGALTWLATQARALRDS